MKGHAKVTLRQCYHLPVQHYKAFVSNHIALNYINKRTIVTLRRHCNNEFYNAVTIQKTQQLAEQYYSLTFLGKPNFIGTKHAFQS
jgi:hypothetical protein